MSTTPNFLTAMPPPPQNGVSLGSLLNTVRSKYSGAANMLSDAITKNTPNYENIPPTARDDLKTAVNVGLGVYGVPVPDPKSEPDEADSEPDINNPKQILASTVPKLGTRQMAMEDINSAIESAAQNQQTLYMKYQHPDWEEPKTYHVEPYSYRGTEDNPKLMAYDKLQKGIRSFSPENIVRVDPSGQSFKPRWDVEIGSTPDNPNVKVK